MANVKLGNNTLTGVTTVRLQNADAAGEYALPFKKPRKICPRKVKLGDEA